MKLRLPFLHSSSSSHFPSSQEQSDRVPSSPCGCGRLRKQSSRRKSQKLSSLQIRELEEAFQVFDSNRDGQIDTSELGFVLRSLGDDPSTQELEQMVKEADRNGDGRINLDEFLMLHSSSEGRWVDELKEAFRFFDADKNGFISVQELYGALTRLGQECSVEDCRQMIKDVDKDGDGHVSFKEFQKMMA